MIRFAAGGSARRDDTQSPLPSSRGRINRFVHADSSGGKAGPRRVFLRGCTSAPNQGARGLKSDSIDPRRIAVRNIFELLFRERCAEIGQDLA